MRLKKLTFTLFLGVSASGALFAQNAGDAEQRPSRQERRAQWQRDRQQQERGDFSPLELHGMIGSGDNLEVSITNPETRESQWVRVRDKKAKWYVESANPVARSVVVRLNGMALKLEMITNTGEPMSIAAQPTPLSAEQVAAEAAKGNILVNGLSAKEAAARMIEMRKSGKQPTPEEMRAFGDAVRQLTPEQRTQYFTEVRTELEKSGESFGPPPRANRTGGGNRAASGTGNSSGGGQSSGSGSGGGRGNR